MRDALVSKMIFQGEHLHVKCAAHMLNIMHQAGLKVIPNAIHRVRDITRLSHPHHPRCKPSTQLYKLQASK